VKVKVSETSTFDGYFYINFFAVLTEMLPSILNQLGAEGIGNLRKLAETLPKSNAAMENPLSTAEGAGEDDLPELIGNFDEPSKTEQV